jgi:hypothetical protein
MPTLGQIEWVITSTRQRDSTLTTAIGRWVHVVAPETPIPQYPVDRADRRDCVWITDALRQQLVAYFPGEHAGVFLFEAEDFLHHSRCRHLLQEKGKKYDNQIADSLILTRTANYKLPSTRSIIHILKAVNNKK